MKIMLTCPNCGNKRFDLVNDEGARCSVCLEYSYTENMTAKVVDDNGNDLPDNQ